MAPVTVLKPLHGDEPLLEEALASVCRQDYPTWQVVFGVQDRADTALPVVRRLRARFPDRDIAVVVDPTPHGPNRKVANLINMLPAAKHDVLVIADSDVHVAPDWLRRLVAALEGPGVGVVTTVYTGLPVHGPLPPTPSRKGRGSEYRPPPPLAGGGWGEGALATLGAMQINHYFLPGALLARAMGRQDCLGATMMLRRETLERIGGFAALVDHLADDNVLGPAGPASRPDGRAGRHRAGDHRAGDHAARPLAPRTPLGTHDPRSGAGPVRRLGAAIPAGLGRAGRAAGRRRALVAGLVRPRLGRSARWPLAASTRRWPLPIAPRSGFCRCASLCRWP